jgi:class 3 adenylate cyclase/CHASE2 domain-containing sensor protein
VKDLDERAPLRRKIWWILFWIFGIFLLPTALEKWHVLTSDSAKVLALLLFVSGLNIFFRRLTFRVGILCLLILSFFYWAQPRSLQHFISGVNHHIQDGFFLLRGPQKTSGQVVIVDIDQKSLEEVGQWPWPRSQLAQVLRNIDGDGARVVGFDIVFAESDRLSMGDWVERIQEVGEFPASAQVPNYFDAKQLKSLVLKEWESRLHVENSLWKPEPNRYEESVIEEYLSYQKKRWDSEQKQMAFRYNKAERTYQAVEYSPPKSPMLEMTRSTSELFYLRLPEQAGLNAFFVMNNDTELGEAFREAKVVAGGLFMTDKAARKEYSAENGLSFKESQGMVQALGGSEAKGVFPGIREAMSQVLNVSEIQKKIYHQGMFNIIPDRSGAARYYTMLMNAPVFQQTLVLKNNMSNSEGRDLLDLDRYEIKIASQVFTYSSLALEMLRAGNAYDDISFTEQRGLKGLFLQRQDGFTYDEAHDKNWLSKTSFPELLPERKFIPLDFKGDLPINFKGYGGPWEPESPSNPNTHFTYVSIADVLQERFPGNIFKNKYVLIGSSDSTLSDVIGSPFRAALPGVEVHATVIDNLIAEDYLLDYGASHFLLFLIKNLCAGILLVFCIAYGSAWVAVSATLSSLLVIPSIGYWTLAHNNLVIDVAYPWISAAFLSAVMVYLNFFIEGKDRRFVVSQFSKMVSSEVLEKLRDDPDGASLKGQKAVVSVMFSDIEGFTSISERLEPKDLVELLNDYFTPMTEIILSYDGFIDKFMGDAIMGCWGVPFPDKEHATKACHAALEQQAVLKDVAKQIKYRYDVDIHVRMGLASGQVSAALMGSKNRKSYTIMGDTVNFGSRLESACRNYAVSILISEATYLLVKDEFELRKIDKLLVKGKNIPLYVYELFAVKGDLDESSLEKYRLYEEALKLHWESKWDEALEILEPLKDIDGPSENLANRIEKYKLMPPFEGWDGSFRLLDK